MHYLLKINLSLSFCWATRVLSVFESLSAMLNNRRLKKLFDPFVTVNLVYLNKRTYKILLSKTFGFDFKLIALFEYYYNCLQKYLAIYFRFIVWNYSTVTGNKARASCYCLQITSTHVLLLHALMYSLCIDHIQAKM